MQSQQIQQRSFVKINKENFTNFNKTIWILELHLRNVFVLTVHAAHEPYEPTTFYFGLKASFDTFQTILTVTLNMFEPYAGPCRRVIRGVDMGLIWADMDWRGLLCFFFVLNLLLNFSVLIQVHSKTSLRKIAEREVKEPDTWKHLTWQQAHAHLMKTDIGQNGPHIS